MAGFHSFLRRLSRSLERGTPVDESGVPEPDALAVVRAYHERTKHHVGRFARSAGYLDWDTQPDPFRTFEGAPRLELPLVADGVETLYTQLFESRAVAPRVLGCTSLGAFFELALGLTAWKELGDSRWALRADPSSGNLHPTEGYAVLAGAPDVPDGVHHYVSRDHVLEQRCALGPTDARALAGRLPAGTFLVGVSSIHWREAWKYGERAFRYCQHDAGHVLATLRCAAAALGWSARLLEGFGDVRVAHLLGLDRDGDFAHVDEHDREHPDAVLLVGAPDGVARHAEVEGRAGELVESIGRGTWAGRPNVLSGGHVDWDVIDAVAVAAVEPPEQREQHYDPPPADRPHSPERAAPGPLAATIIRQRRSAVALDGETSIPASALFEMLARTLPREGCGPWDMLPWRPRIHLALLVHRVVGLEPGLYVLERDARVHEQLVAELGDKASWTRPAACPDHLRLFLIGTGDYRRAAAAVSCSQDIAADGAFSLGMLAEFEDALGTGAHRYRRLFWEAGVVGQVLYLESEAHGVRGTGIGCYFDDAFHELVGLGSARFQSLYHFTVGGPVDDARLVTRPAYAHLERAGSAPPPEL